MDRSISRQCWERIQSNLKRESRTLEIGGGLSTALFEQAGCCHTAVDGRDGNGSSGNSAAVAPSMKRFLDGVNDAAKPFDVIYVSGDAIHESGLADALLLPLEHRRHDGTVIVVGDTQRPEARWLAERLAIRCGSTLEIAGGPRRQFAICRPPESTRTIRPDGGLKPSSGAPILVIGDYQTLSTRMDRSTYYRYFELGRRRRVRMFGPGSRGFHSGMTIDDAIATCLEGQRPAAIIHGPDLGNSNKSLVRGLEDSDIPTVLDLQDPWTKAADQFSFIRRARFRAAFTPHAAYVPRYARNCPECRFFWHPNSVNGELFRDYGGDKRYDVLLFGCIAPTFYPFRFRLAQLLEKCPGIRFRRLDHPGYWDDGSVTKGVHFVGADLSRAINGSWITIATKGIQEGLFDKYFEIAASASLIAGDLPAEGVAIFGKNYLPLDPSASDQAIVAEVLHCLEDKDRIAELASNANRSVIERHTVDVAGDNLLRFVDWYIAGPERASTWCVDEDEVMTTLPQTPRIQIGKPDLRVFNRETVAHSSEAQHNRMKMACQNLTRSRAVRVNTVIRSSLCMIVRDNERTLDACLESIKPWVDEMIVVDTGSRDTTPQVAERHGARVFHFPWCDDFSAARNESIRHANGKWIFWMDSDDTIDAPNGIRLKALPNAHHKSSILAFTMQVHCPSNDDDTDVTVVDHVKMFRNRPDLRFEGRIHEQILPAIRAGGGEIAWTDIFLTHSGADHSPEGRRAKHERDMRLLELEFADRPDHPFTLFNLGMTYADMGQHERAVDALCRSIMVAGESESHVRKAYALLASSLTELRRYEPAWRICEKGRKVYPDDPELLFRQAIIAQQLHQFDKAADLYRSILDRRGGDHYFSSFDHGILGFKTRHNLALVYRDMGDVSKAEAEWRLAIKEKVFFQPAWRALTDLFVSGKRLGDLEQLLQEANRHPCLEPQRQLIEAGLEHLNAAGIESTREMLQRAVAVSPRDMDARRRLAEHLFRHGPLLEAEEAFLHITQSRPDDASAFFNLGTIYMSMQHYRAAVQNYKLSLDLRPNWPPTLKQLASAHEQLREWGQAIDFMKSVVDLDAGDRDALAALDRLHKFAKL